MNINAVHSAASSGEHLAYIDLLRGFAIFGVLAAHGGLGRILAGLSGLPLHIDWLLGADKHGDSLFFVVSAYTLMRSVDIRHYSEPLPWPQIVRRFFGIAPVYYLVITLVFVFHGEGFDGYSFYLTSAWLLALGAATLLFHLIEKPGMRLGQMLLSRSPKPILATR